MWAIVICAVAITTLLVARESGPTSEPTSPNVASEQNPTSKEDASTNIVPARDVAQQDPVSYQYSTDLWTKVPSPNTKVGLRSAGETYAGAVLLGTVAFPETLIRKESAALIGIKRCGSDKDPELVACQASSFKGISITSYPESYESLAKKFSDEFSRTEIHSRDISIDSRAGKVFFHAFEKDGDAFYLFPSKSKEKTFVIKVGFNGSDSEQTSFFDEQLRVILASIYQLE